MDLPGLVFTFKIFVDYCWSLSVNFSREYSWKFHSNPPSIRISLENTAIQQNQTFQSGRSDMFPAIQRSHHRLWRYTVVFRREVSHSFVQFIQVFYSFWCHYKNSCFGRVIFTFFTESIQKCKWLRYVDLYQPILLNSSTTWNSRWIL